MLLIYANVLQGIIRSFIIADEPRFDVSLHFQTDSNPREIALHSVAHLAAARRAGKPT